MVTVTFRTNADGSLVCQHRDLSCCPVCSDRPEIVDVYGHHYFVPDPVERAALRLLVEGDRP